MLFPSSNKLTIHKVLFSETGCAKQHWFAVLKNEVCSGGSIVSFPLPNSPAAPCTWMRTQCHVLLNKIPHVQSAGQTYKPTTPLLELPFAYALKCQILSSWSCPNWILPGRKLRGACGTAASWQCSLWQACCVRDGPSGFSANILSIQTTKLCFKLPEMKIPFHVVSPMSSAPQLGVLGEVSSWGTQVLHKFRELWFVQCAFFNAEIPHGGNCTSLLWKLVCISAGVLNCCWCSPRASWRDRISFKLHLLLF